MNMTGAVGALDTARESGQRSCRPEYGDRVGKIAEENPDLPLEFIKGVLEARREMANGETTPFEFRDA